MKNIVLPEIVKVGVYDAEMVHKSNITKNRKTSIFEIELPKEDGGVSYIDNKKSEITTDLIICAKPGQVRHTELPFKCFYAHIIVDDGMAYEILTKAPSFFRTKHSEKYKSIFTEMCELYEPGHGGNELLLQSKLLELIHLIYEDVFISLDTFSAKEDYIIEQAIHYIDENYTQQLSLEDMASNVSLSPIYFHNRFKAATGETPHEYLMGLRIKKAVNLLVTSDFSVAEIAYECGFSSQSYFSYVFKKKMNLSPREYMRKMYERYSM